MSDMAIPAFKIGGKYIVATAIAFIIPARNENGMSSSGDWEVHLITGHVLKVDPAQSFQNREALFKMGIYFDMKEVRHIIGPNEEDFNEGYNQD